MDKEKLREVVEAIPPGRWMSYTDAATLAGATSARAAMGVNQALIRLGCAGAHRVLKADGTVSPTALGNPEKVLRALRREGVRFEGGKADPQARLAVDLVAG
jgi:alkylated DNA nucleotide flippase Atl1